MSADRGFAPAKINFTLHVTAKQDDGYHLLDSLVGFAGVGDQISVRPSDTISIEVDGPFKDGVPLDDSNIIVKAAMALQHARKVPHGAQITLTKNLPHPAGIGGGSSDAAAVLRLLSDMWGVDPIGPRHPFALALGADVPVCIAGPAPMRMAGVGNILRPAPALPDCALVLVNAGVPAQTGAVFQGLTTPNNDTMSGIPDGLDLDAFIRFLRQQRNDLLAPARAISDGVDAALAKLDTMPQVKHSFMSGSGATCVGIVKDMTAARQVARVIQVSQMHWWVAAAPLLS